MFYSKPTFQDRAVEGASKIVQGVYPTTEASKALARMYLDDVYDPRKVPVPLEYFKDWYKKE